MDLPIKMKAREKRSGYRTILKNQPNKNISVGKLEGWWRKNNITKKLGIKVVKKKSRIKICVEQKSCNIDTLLTYSVNSTKYVYFDSTNSSNSIKLPGTICIQSVCLNIVQSNLHTKKWKQNLFTQQHTWIFSEMANDKEKKTPSANSYSHVTRKFDNQKNFSVLP